MDYREKRISFQALVILGCASFAQASTHMCFIGPDSLGSFLQKVVTESYANNCEDCLCTVIRETCLLGPDSLGHFAISEVDPDFANNCDRETCTCSSHANYLEEYQSRIQNAIEIFEVEHGVKFDPDIDQSLIIDGDAARPPITPRREEESETEEVEESETEEEEESEEEILPDPEPVPQPEPEPPVVVVEEVIEEPEIQIEEEVEFVPPPLPTIIDEPTVEEPLPVEQEPAEESRPTRPEEEAEPE